MLATALATRPNLTDFLQAYREHTEALQRGFEVAAQARRKAGQLEGAKP